MAKKLPIRGKTKGPYWLNDKAEFYWEIVRRGMVERHIERHWDESDEAGAGTGNRAQALRAVERLNKKWQAAKAGK